MTFFQSDVVSAELAEIQELQEEVYGALFKFPSMPKEDKQYHVDCLERLIEKQKILYTRLSLSDDPVAKQMKENLSGVATTYNYKGEQPITSLEEAIKFFDIDVNEYEVTGYSCNAWDVSTKTGKKTNYQVKLTLKPRAEELDYQEVKKQLDYAISKVNINKIPGVNTGVICLADLHIGADIRNLQRTPDFNFKSVIQYLKDIANQVNQRGYEKVEIIFLGDFIESFTGLNHINSWKSMGKGM